MGPGPNDFRTTLEANKTTIQNGLSAIETLKTQQGLSVPTVSAEHLQELKQAIDALDSSIANINMVLQVITMSITTLNNGFANACATGLVPGQPIPAFNKNAFAHQAHGDSPGSGSSAADEQKLKAALEKNGMSSDAADIFMVNALDAGVDFDTITNLLNKGQSVDSIEQAFSDAEALKGRNISNESINALFKKGGNIKNTIADANNLLDKGVKPEQVNQLISKNSDLPSTYSSITHLLGNSSINIDKINQWIQEGIDPNYADILTNKGIDIDANIKSFTQDYTNNTPGYKRWGQLEKIKKTAITDALKKWAGGSWANGIQTFGNDGTPFNNNPVKGRNGVPTTPMPKGTTTPPYTEYTVTLDGTKGNWRIVVDSKGKAYFMDHYNPFGVDGKDAPLPIPFDFIKDVFH